MRKNAHYHSSFVGHRDNLLLSGVTREQPDLQDVPHRRVARSSRSTCRRRAARGTSATSQMEKLIEGDPKNAAMAAFTADPFLKYVVVVDDDVDITNDSDVLHAIATRVRWDYGRVPGHVLEGLAARSGVVRPRRGLAPRHEGRDRRDAEGELPARDLDTGR